MMETENSENKRVMDVAQEEVYKSGSVQYIDSREVAEMVGKEHKMLLRDIRRYLIEMEKINQENSQCKIAPSDFFIESTFNTERGKEYPCYLVTKKGCEFIAHKLTGIKGTKFTATYINRFHEMEDKLADENNAFTQEVVEKIVEFMQSQADFNRRVMQRIERGWMRHDAKETPKVKPNRYGGMFNLPNKEVMRRVGNIDKVVSRIAELRSESKTRILHLIYVELEESAGVSLDSYRHVYQSETGDDRKSNLYTIVQFDWMYAHTLKICGEALDKYEVFYE